MAGYRDGRYFADNLPFHTPPTSPLARHGAGAQQFLRSGPSADEWGAGLSPGVIEQARGIVGAGGSAIEIRDTALALQASLAAGAGAVAASAGAGSASPRASDWGQEQEQEQEPAASAGASGLQAPSATSPSSAGWAFAMPRVPRGSGPAMRDRRGVLGHYAPTPLAIGGNGARARSQESPGAAGAEDTGPSERSSTASGACPSCPSHDVSSAAVVVSGDGIAHCHGSGALLPGATSSTGPSLAGDEGGMRSGVVSRRVSVGGD